MGYVINHLMAITGTGLALYFLWSMILNPAQGPLSGTILPLVTGILGFVVMVWIAVRGLTEIYAFNDEEKRVA